MSLTIQLRPAQAEILKYQDGLMAVSAVPGSGKTFTLSLLAAQLIAAGKVEVTKGQQILVVTYMNSGADNFRRRIREHLEALGVPPAGYDVRTLHSLGLEIVRLAQGGGSRTSVGANDLLVLDEAQSNLYLTRAVDNWRTAHPDEWASFLPEGDQRTLNQWRNIVERTARAFIRTAKNERYQPFQIYDQLQLSQTTDLHDFAADESEIAYEFVSMFAGIYGQYQTILSRQGALDFDDLIWQAANLVEQREDIAVALAQRWPYVLEDEAQDSVPLQEVLLGGLARQTGNWVRVGDPNQAITTTFTAADPKYFKQFIARPEVELQPLPNSGRCAVPILEAANTIMHWVSDHHPVPEVAAQTFLRQEILPTPAGDAQPNPPFGDIRIKVYRNREDEELPKVARLAQAYAEKYPEQTLAILVSTNDIGHQIAEHLEAAKAEYDNLLRGGSRERRIASALHALLAILAEPLSRKHLETAYGALYEIGHPAVAAARWAGTEEAATALERRKTLLRSAGNVEALLFPRAGESFAAALPDGVAKSDELLDLEQFLAFIRHVFTFRPLPIDDLALALGDELFASGSADQLDLALAYQLAGVLRRWRDAEPDWRLPELVAQLGDVAAGRRQLPINDPTELGFEPTPGRITLITQHKAKGLEWDAVFLVGVDARWLPGNLDGFFLGTYEFLGGNPEALVTAQLLYLMQGHDGTLPGRSATETANIDVISERLRLFYVALTRARRFLHISRSRATRSYNRERPAEPATVMGVLYEYLGELKNR
ncbi:MAG: ATP-dependent helicase [Ardenticatenales bacterium]|nr:ATP-dependent helicase [Ardenticatenales bacterium]